MFCPNCGQERISTETSFCSRCGFLLTGTADILQMGGLIPRLSPEMTYRPPSPRSRGVKQGIFALLLAVLIVPLLTVLSIAINLRSPILPIIATILLVIGGLLRMAYAWLFESPVPEGRNVGQSVLSPAQSLLNQQSHAQLPPQQSYPVTTFTAPATGNWRDTNDLEPHSVTEGTTRLLENEESAQ